MMRRAAVEHAQVNVGARGLRKTLKKIFGELGLKIAYAFGGDFRAADAMRPAAEVDGGGGEGFVHGHQKITGAENSTFCAQSFPKGFAESDSGVFDGVVLIDVEIAVSFDGEIESAVAGQEFEHVVEETDSGGDIGFAAAVEIEAEADIGFVGVATN